MSPGTTVQANGQTRLLLALGSSLGDRRQNLRAAIASLRQHGVAIRAISPVVETAAMLPSHASPEWNVPYLNLVLDAVVDANDCETISRLTKSVQRELEAKPVSRWAPRKIDIDILCVGDEPVQINGKQIPNLDDVSRPFNITPLLHLDPARTLPGIDRSMFALSRTLTKPVPVWMGVANLTPDSFSESGTQQDFDGAAQVVNRLIDDGANIIDIGGESVRPGATAISPEAEWARIEKTLHWLCDRLAGDPLAPTISVDTRHPQTAARAIEAGVGFINDVTGLRSPEMLRLAAQSNAQFVVMHSLTVPPTNEAMLSADRDPMVEISQWAEKGLDQWQRAGVDPSRLILDPGICFGKNRLHSQEIMRRIAELRGLGCRVLVGHSRKGYLRSMEQRDVDDRDLETVVASMAMIASGVDVLRVHDVGAHARGWMVWSHLSPSRPFA